MAEGLETELDQEGSWIHCFRERHWWATVVLSLLMVDRGILGPSLTSSPLPQTWQDDYWTWIWRAWSWNVQEVAICYREDAVNFWVFLPKRVPKADGRKLISACDQGVAFLSTRFEIPSIFFDGRQRSHRLIPRTHQLCLVSLQTAATCLISSAEATQLKHVVCRGTKITWSLWLGADHVILRIVTYLSATCDGIGRIPSLADHADASSSPTYVSPLFRLHLSRSRVAKSCNASYIIQSSFSGEAGSLTRLLQVLTMDLDFKGEVYRPSSGNCQAVEVSNDMMRLILIFKWRPLCSSHQVQELSHPCYILKINAFVDVEKPQRTTP